MGNDTRGSHGTDDLELDGDHPEIEDLNSGPQDKVGLESRQIHVPELLCQCSLSSSLGDRHVGEEAGQTYTGKSVSTRTKARPTATATKE
jgi:hypothetical protein